MGGREEATPYLKNQNDEIVSDDIDKEELFRSKWEHVFKISPQENLDFDS